MTKWADIHTCANLEAKVVARLALAGSIAAEGLVAAGARPNHPTADDIADARKMLSRVVETVKGTHEGEPPPVFFQAIAEHAFTERMSFYAQAELDHEREINPPDATGWAEGGNA